MSLVKKLFLKSGYTMDVLNAPDGFELPLGDLEAQVTRSDVEPLDFALLFVQSKADLDKQAASLVSRLKPTATFWVAYPKKSAKKNTDIHRDAGWDTLRDHGYQGVSLVSIDDTWSAMRFKK